MQKMLWSVLFFTSVSAMALDAEIKSPHFQTSKDSSEAQITCHRKQNTADCDLTTYSVERIERAPSGVCPYKKVASVHKVTMNIDSTGAQAQGEITGANGNKFPLSINLDQNSVKSIKVSDYQFDQVGDIDPCDVYLKSMISSASVKLPTSGSLDTELRDKNSSGLFGNTKAETLGRKVNTADPALAPGSR